MVSNMQRKSARSSVGSKKFLGRLSNNQDVAFPLQKSTRGISQRNACGKSSKDGALDEAS